jgi:DNA-binding protein Alba|tara:strand:+ start:1740 stop:1877 length:138 start_codon:yes stop_codon:yes gene_type:complete
MLPEIVRNRFMEGVKVKDIVIDTEELTRDDGTKMNVSTMEITFSK